MGTPSVIRALLCKRTYVRVLTRSSEHSSSSVGVAPFRTAATVCAATRRYDCISWGVATDRLQAVWAD